MPRCLLLAALALAMTAGPALAAPTPTPIPRPKTLPIRGVTVDIQPIELAPGLPGNAPAGTHVEQPPALTPFRALPLGGQKLEPLRGFQRPKPSASPSRKP